jgi:hypothetical protein
LTATGFGVGTSINVELLAPALVARTNQLTLSALASKITVPAVNVPFQNVNREWFVKPCVS